MAFAQEKNSQADFPNELKVPYFVGPACVSEGTPGHWWAGFILLLVNYWMCLTFLECSNEG